MYHCHINFFFLGNQRKLFKILEGMPPLEHFTHEYFESKTPYESMISKADVIIADLEKMDAASTLQMLLSEKKINDRSYRTCRQKPACRAGSTAWLSVRNTRYLDTPDL